MKIAMIGQKGIPAHSGGIQQHVEAISRLLVQRGHEVVVYCRRSYCGRDARSERTGGLSRVVYPSVPTKHLDAITHSLLGTIDVAARRADIVHYHAIGPAALAPLARFAGLPVVVTVHGLDWQREKWGAVASRCLRLGERVAARAARRLIVVSPVLKDYFREHYGVGSDFIPNGVTPMARRNPDRLLDFGIRPGRYLLAAARLVPEKGLHYLLRAFRDVPTDTQLVIAGGSGCDDQYERQLRRCDDARVIFTGAADRELMEELFSHAKLFVLPSDLEGMPVVLLEAMSMGLPVLVSDIAVNRCVVEDAGSTFEAGNVESLREKLSELLEDADLHARWSDRARAKVERYNWEDIATQLEQLYREVVPNSQAAFAGAAATRRRRTRGRERVGV